MRPALIGLLSAAAVAAAESGAGGSCVAAERHEFDFVIGNWLVRDPAGQVVATATIARAYSGCVLIETWLGAGTTGESLGVIGFERESGRWRRQFLDSAGIVLSLSGQLDGSAMVMTGKQYRPEGARLHRITWTPRRDGTVEERWEVSADGGESWQPRFTGVFHRISE